MADAFDAVMLALAVALGLGHLAACVGALAHYVRASRRPPADTWARWEDPDALLPPPWEPPRVAPPRERGPEVRRG